MPTNAENGKNKSKKKKKTRPAPAPANEEPRPRPHLHPLQQAQAQLPSPLRRSSSLKLSQAAHSQVLVGAASTSSSNAQQSQAANVGVYYPSTYRDRLLAENARAKMGAPERESKASRWTQVLIEYSVLLQSSVECRVAMPVATRGAQVLDAILHRSPSKHSADKRHRRQAQMRPSASAEALHNARLFSDTFVAGPPTATFAPDAESLTRSLRPDFSGHSSSARAKQATSRELLRWASPQPHESLAGAQSSSPPPLAAQSACPMPRSAPASPNLSRARSVRMRTPLGVQLEQQLREAVERELVREKSAPLQQVRVRVLRVCRMPAARACACQCRCHAAQRTFLCFLFTIGCSRSASQCWRQ